MDWWEAIILGVVEGITEYLPVSSTGHLILTQRILGIREDDASNAYAICIQAGAIVAVLGLYRQRVVQMVRGVAGKLRIGRACDDGFQLWVNIVAAFLPAAVLGLLFDEKIEEFLFGLEPIVFAWFVGGVAILLISWRYPDAGFGKGKDLSSLSWRWALAVGVIQCLAMWPGTSRSLVTILGGILVGLSLSAAVEFSFLLGVVTLLAATLYSGVKNGDVMLQSYGLLPLVLGAVAAWLSAVVAVRWMVNYLQRHGMQLFGYYRVVLAVVVAICLWMQILSN